MERKRSHVEVEERRDRVSGVERKRRHGEVEGGARGVCGKRWREKGVMWKRKGGGSGVNEGGKEVSRKRERKRIVIERVETGVMWGGGGMRRNGKGKGKQGKGERERGVRAKRVEDRGVSGRVLGGREEESQGAYRENKESGEEGPNQKFSKGGAIERGARERGKEIKIEEK